MRPILYDSNETNFTTNGIGVLTDAVSCFVTEERNGLFELTMQYPIMGIHFPDLSLRKIIKAKSNQTSNPQLFRIYRITRPFNGIVTINAEHISYDMSGIPIQPFTAENIQQALVLLKENTLTDCPFTFESDKSTVAKMDVHVPCSLRSQLGGKEGSLLDTYRGEYEFDNFNVYLHNNRGIDRGVTIRYGKNLTDIEQEQNCANVYTGVYPYWIDVNTGDVTQLDQKIVRVEGVFPFTKILMLDCTQYFTEQPTQEQLLARTRTYIEQNNIGIPKVNLRVSFIQLEQSEEYKNIALLERVSLCDTVHVEFPALGVNTDAKAIKLTYNVLLDRVESIELGEVRANLADKIIEHEDALNMHIDFSRYEKAVHSMTETILGASGGAVRLIDTDSDGELDTLYIADDPDIQKATKVWRFNHEGWGASENGYNGPFKLGATLQHGIVADFITTGILDAALIKAGILSDALGNNVWNLDTGEFKLSSGIKVGNKDLAEFAQESGAEGAKEYTKGMQQQIDAKADATGLQIEVARATQAEKTASIFARNYILESWHVDSWTDGWSYRDGAQTEGIGSYPLDADFLEDYHATKANAVISFEVKRNLTVTKEKKYFSVGIAMQIENKDGSISWFNYIGTNPAEGKFVGPETVDDSDFVKYHYYINDAVIEADYEHDTGNEFDHIYSFEYVYISGVDSDISGTIAVKNEKLELTYKTTPTPWSPPYSETYSTVTQTADMIATKVSRGNLISTINQTADEVSIHSENLNINGAVSLNNNFKIDKNTGSVEINGGSLSLRYSDTYGMQIGKYGDLAIGEKISNISSDPSVNKFSSNKCKFQVSNAGDVKAESLQFWGQRNSSRTTYELISQVKLYKVTVGSTWEILGVGFQDRSGDPMGNFSTGYYSGGAYNYAPTFSVDYIKAYLGANLGDTTVNGNFTVVAGSKNRAVDTKDFGQRLLYCYETPTPYFGDIGDGVISESGDCRIEIDPIFENTVDARDYQVFLQAYGEGLLYVKERANTYFVVSGTAGLEFGWEIKAKQCDHNGRRLDENNKFNIRESTNKDNSYGNYAENSGILTSESYGDYAGYYINQIIEGRLAN